MIERLYGLQTAGWRVRKYHVETPSRRSRQARRWEVADHGDDAKRRRAGDEFFRGLRC
jgi:hypothetical protein